MRISNDLLRNFQNHSDGHSQGNAKPFATPLHLSMTVEIKHRLTPSVLYGKHSLPNNNLYFYSILSVPVNFGHLIKSDIRDILVCDETFITSRTGVIL